MRSVLVSLGPWEWPTLFIIAAVFVAVALLWRRAERALGESPGPLNARWFATTALWVCIASVALLLLVNKAGPVKIRSYGVMLLCGFIAGGYYVARVGPKRGLPVPMIIDMILMDLVFAIVGSRVMFVLLSYQAYATNPATIASVWSGGLSFHGGLLGAVIATFIFCRWRKIRFAVLTDICTPGIPIGYALTRVGCFLNGCCHGGPTDLPWGVVFPENAAQYPMPVHPTQLYASLGSFALWGLLVWAWPRMRRPGQLFPLYMISYSVLRFLCEYTRRGYTGEVYQAVPSLTVAQFACILIAAAGLLLFLWLQRLPYENPTTAMAVEPAAEPSEEARAAPEARPRGRKGR